MTIDHPDGDGGRHRAEMKSKYLYRWLEKLGFPTEAGGYRFRLLCMNCNFAGRFGKSCPHTLETASSIRLSFIGRSAAA